MRFLLSAPQVQDGWRMKSHAVPSVMVGGTVEPVRVSLSRWPRTGTSTVRNSAV